MLLDCRVQIITSAFDLLKKLSWIIKQSSSASHPLISSVKASQPWFSTLYNTLTFLFHQSQQKKNSGNTKIDPEIIVEYRQQVSIFFTCVPVILILSDFTLVNSSLFNQLIAVLKENAFPLKQNTSQLVELAQGPKFKKFESKDDLLLKQGSLISDMSYSGQYNYSKYSKETSRMNESQQKDKKQAYTTTLNRRLSIFALKAIKSPIELRLKSGKIATGNLLSLDPNSFDIIVSNFCTNGEKQRSEVRYVKFNEIQSWAVFIADNHKN